MGRVEELKERLESNPRLSYSTIRIYLNQIDTLIKTYGENPTLSQLNQFIAEKCKKRQPVAKYAIKEYLNMIGRGNEYNQLVQARIKKPIKPKVFLTKEQLVEIINSIKREPYKTIGKLQMAFVARASSIIKIERKRIRREQDRIRFILMEKREKPKIVYLRDNFWPMIEPYYNQPNKYIFLGKEADKYSDEQINRKANTLYKRYLEQLQDAARGNNIELSTHDIRRTVANNINNITNNPRIAQRLLDHESADTTSRYLQDNEQEATSVLLDYQQGI